MSAGTIYGVLLNDRSEREQLEPAFHQDPYKAPPQAPVVYIKPRLSASAGGQPVPLPEDEHELMAAATLALLFATDAAAVSAENAWDHVGAVSLALDISLPTESYYRPTIAQRCRDGFLPLGAAVAPVRPDQIVTLVDGQEVHRWSLSRLVRPIDRLIADLSAFMTLRAGDTLLVGLPGDAPRVRLGQAIRVEAEGLPPLRTTVAREVLS